MLCRTAIQAQLVLDMQTAIEATIQPGLESLRAAEQAAPNAELLQIHEELCRIAASIGGLRAHSQEVQLAGLMPSRTLLVLTVQLQSLHPQLSSARQTPPHTLVAFFLMPVFI